MSQDFHQRWTRAARAARRAPEDADGAPPPGFTARLLARYQAEPAEPWADLIAALIPRAVAASALLFAASAALALWQWQPLPPPPDWIEWSLNPEALLP